MAIIDAEGLFNGDRISNCSDMARLHWCHLFLASNGYGRIEINYHKIIANVYSRFKEKPSEAEVMGWFKEYASAHLIFLYQRGRQLWGQWDCKPERLNKYKTAEDKRSPEPPTEKYKEWQEEYVKNQQHAKVVEAFIHLSQLTPQSLEKVSEKFQENSPLGVGVGEGDGIGKKKKPSASPSARGGNSQTAKATGGTRHTRIKQLIQGFYQDWAGAECPWDGSEAGNLDKLLKATPHWVDSQFVTCLENLARSDCIAPGARPRAWIGDLPKFLKGPLDQYKNPKAVANGQTGSASKADAREQRIFERAAKFARNRVDSAGEPLGQSSSPLALPGDGGHGISGLAGDTRAAAVGVGSSGPRQVDALPAKT